MKLSKEVITILKNFSVINQSLYVDELNCIKTTSEEKNVIAVYSSVSDIFPREFGIFDMVKLLSIVQLYDLEEVDFKFKEKWVEIKYGRNLIKYIYAPKERLRTVNDIEPAEAYRDFNIFDIELSITEDELKHIKRASNIIDLPHLSIKSSEDEGCYIQLQTENTAIKNTYRLDIDDYSGEGEVSVRVGNLDIIPGDYKIYVGDNKVLKFEHSEIDLFYFISALS